MRSTLDRLYHKFYLWAQKRQSYAKRHKDPTFRTERHLAFLRANLRGLWPWKVLCLGPRNSLEMQHLRHGGLDVVVGLDLFSASDEIKVGDMHDMPFPTEEFGMVWASHVLEHAREPEVVFAEINRVLKPGGYLFAAYPSAFKTNWHDRWDYGAPGKMALRYLPGWTTIGAGHAENAGSLERFGLFRKP